MSTLLQDLHAQLNVLGQKIDRLVADRDRLIIASSQAIKAIESGDGLIGAHVDLREAVEQARRP